MPVNVRLVLRAEHVHDRFVSGSLRVAYIFLSPGGKRHRFLSQTAHSFPLGAAFFELALDLMHDAGASGERRKDADGGRLLSGNDGFNGVLFLKALPFLLANDKVGDVYHEPGARSETDRRCPDV